MNEIRSRMLTNGYSIKSELTLTDELKEIVKELSILYDKNNKEIVPDEITEEVMKQHAINFFKEFYTIHKINHISKENYDIIMLLYYYYNKNIIHLMKSKKTKISPFELPIKYIGIHLDDCEICPVTINFELNKDSTELNIDDINIDDINEKLLKKQPLCFDKITLFRKINELLTSNYIHEITHSQLDKGIIEDYNNGEIFSIFNELLYLYLKDNELFKQKLLSRINSVVNYYTDINEYQEKNGMCKDISYIDYSDYIRYFISTLKAFKLLLLYINNEYKLTTITKDINTSFKRRRTVEEVLDKYNFKEVEIVDPDNIRRLLI